MDFILGGRAAGKTQKMVEWFAAAPDTRILIVADSRRRNEVLQRLRGILPLRHVARAVENRVIVADTLNSAVGLKGVSRDTQLGIDDLETCLHILLERPVAAVADTPWVVHRLGAADAE